MKVLQIIDSLNVGGAEVLTVNISNSLSKFPNFNVNLCTTRQEGPLKENLSKSVSYHFLKKKSILNFIFYKRLYELIKKNDINIIHAHSTSFFSMTLVKLFLSNKRKLIWHCHSGSYVSLKGIKLLLLKLCSYKFDAIINVNNELFEWSNKKLHSKNNIVLNNFATFSNHKKNTSLKGIDGKRIVCLAGLRPVKNHELLIKGFLKTLEQHPEWTLHLVGKSYEDEYYDSIIKIISENNLEKNIFLYGLRNDIKHILDQSSIGVLTSLKEGLPISVLEYNLANLPVLLSEGSNSAYLIPKDDCVPNHNSVVFAEKMNNIIENIAFRNKIIQSLNLKISKSFSEDYFMQELKKIYTTV